MACSADSGATSATSASMMTGSDAARNADSSQPDSEVRKIMAFRAVAMTPV